MIIYSLASGGVSIAALFLAGYIPGILTGLFLMVVAFFGLKKDIQPLIKVILKMLFQVLLMLYQVCYLFIVIGGIVMGLLLQPKLRLLQFCMSSTRIIYNEIKINELSSIILSSTKPAPSFCFWLLVRYVCHGLCF